MAMALASTAVILCWAYSPIGIHIGLETYGPGHLALLRFLVASIFMALIALSMRISLPRVKDLPLLFVLGLFAVTLHHIALNLGQRGVSAGAASVLAQSTPVFTAIIARFVLREHVTPWRWACILGGVTGAAIVVLGDRGIGSFNAHGLLILLAALSWSIYFALQKRYSRRYSTLTMVCYTVWSGTALLCIHIPGLAGAVANAPIRVNLAVFTLGIFPSALAYLAWAYVLDHADVSRASIALYLIPPTAMLMASVMLGERPSAWVLIGGGIVMLSVLAMNMERGRITALAGKV